jgi:hypothetical protein
MIDKISGKVADAVMSFGGFLGMETVTTRCLARADLRYGESGYRLEGAPTYGRNETPNWSDRR